jgi:bifunctional DNase/RNase
MVDSECREMTVRGLTLDPATNAPIVVLRDAGGTRLLPIWIGIFEANAIALEMEKVSMPRPMTHDLVKNLLGLLGAGLTRVVVDNLRGSTFYASIYLTHGGREHRVDARPSDAIALALRAGAPIFVTLDVLERAQGIADDDALGAPEQWRAWLDGIRPGDFGTMAGGTPDEGSGRADG